MRDAEGTNQMIYVHVLLSMIEWGIILSSGRFMRSVGVRLLSKRDDFPESLISKR